MQVEKRQARSGRGGEGERKERVGTKENEERGREREGGIGRRECDEIFYKGEISGAKETRSRIERRV